MDGLGLIAIIAVMGGAIAYIGDKLGTRVGKKKLSMFGLRPKHTSIIVTIVTGILISAATIGIMTAVSWDMRTALFGMEAIKAELLSLNAEVAAKTTALESSRAALDLKNAEYAEINDKVQQTAAQLSKSMAELTEVTAERDRTITALTTLQSDYALAQRDLADYQENIKSLQTTKDTLDRRISGLNGQIGELNTAKASLQSDLDHLNELTENLKNGLQNIRGGTMVFRTNEVLSTSVVHGGQSKEDITNQVTAIIYNTNQHLLDKLEVTDKKLEILWVTRAEFDQTIASLADKQQEMIVRISAAGNTVYGEPVIGRFELFPNYFVYNKGTAIYSEVIQLDADNAKAEEAVISFLQKVNSTAIKQGILSDPIQGTVGSMSGSELFEIMNRVKRLTGKVELTAVAKNDIYTVGPLQIEIKMKNVF